MRKISNSCNYNTFLYIFNPIFVLVIVNLQPSLSPKFVGLQKKLRRIVAVFSFR